jgi:hypothetical protein
MSPTPQLRAGSSSTIRNGPRLELRHVGDGRDVYRALARIIVRGFIATANLNAADRCEDVRQAG